MDKYGFDDAYSVMIAILTDIPILMDPRVKLEHLKHALDSRLGPDDMQIFTGIKKPHYYLQSINQILKY